MVILETPFVEVVHYRSAEALLIKWKGHADISSFMDTYLKGLEYVANNQPLKYFCTDLTLVGSLRREQEAWLALDFYQEVHNTIQDTIYAAIVFSEDHFKALVVNYQLPADTTQQDFMHFNYFTSQDEAWFWLESIKKGHDTAVLPMTPNFSI